MTTRMKYAPRRLAIPAASIAAMLLAGCSSGNIGESWQCPLADTGSCDSVAAADPAVPDTGAARRTLLKEPLWRQRGGEPGSPAPTPCAADCDGGFDPFGWLMRLLGADEDDEPAAKAASPSSDAAAPPPETGPEPTEPAAATLPAKPAAGEIGPGQGEPDAGDLRTGEVVARIWIAPFVDADRVYREASWVRAVLEPAGWKLPR
ncbi:MAG: TraV family lipoprotein [Defluviicoccus sp.]|nr:TraV family lipoprotein [Defluviicoccus sp.]